MNGFVSGVRYSSVSGMIRQVHMYVCACFVQISKTMIM